MSRPYQTKSGKTQFMPSMEEVKEMIDAQEGFCLSCGAQQDGVEPDARNYKCDACGEYKVFGAEELVLMDLVY